MQRANIRELIVGDLEALGEIAHFLDDHTELGKRYEFENMLVNLRKSLLRELDFTIEANNLHTLAQNLAELTTSLFRSRLRLHHHPRSDDGIHRGRRSRRSIR